MSTTIIPSSQQANGAFDGNKILEKKPIGFPQDDGGVHPYSNLFYWAHAWSDPGGLIGEHPHKGFDIMSYVIKGEIEHYDSKLRGWKKLKEGDVQIIRSGNGISHAEKILPSSAIFQIWFDPNLAETLSQPASYSDYADSAMPVENFAGMSVKHLAGNGSPFSMHTPGVTMRTIKMDAGNFSLEKKAEKIVSAFLLSGNMELNGQKMEPGDFAIVNDNTVKVDCKVSEASRLFLIESLQKPGYPLYADGMR